ncbi:MAG: hypothetical protein KIT31_17780 [Deltaproteobacteria bacterium]|nr:hypothetical protein [Deltaproteobacteria bacterium]
MLAAAACGDDGGAAPDAPPKDIGFNKPTKSLKGNREVADNQWMELGPADLACLGTPSADAATTVDVALSTKVTDFQSGNLAPGTSVIAFPNQSIGQPFGAAVVADEMAKLTLTIPTGTKRFGFKMTSDSALDTLLLNQTVLPDMAAQMLGQIQSVSKTTAQTLPALIGVSRTAGTGVLAGAVRDCANHEISNFIATVSSTKGEVNHVDGADTYYFSSSVGLPVRHSQKAASSEDGLFMIIELQAAPKAFVQVWGYVNDTDLAADKLTLVAELETAVITDTVITGSYEPLRQ